MNSKREIVAEIDTASMSLHKVVTASLRDLNHLKRMHPASKVKYGDICPHTRQNCDAKSRVLTQAVVNELGTYVPGSQATQLYLQAAVWTHSPYRSMVSVHQLKWLGAYGRGMGGAHDVEALETIYCAA